MRHARGTGDLPKCGNIRGGDNRQKKWWYTILACMWWIVWREGSARCFEERGNYIQKIKMNSLCLFLYWYKQYFLSDAEAVIELKDLLKSPGIYFGLLPANTFGSTFLVLY